MKTRKRKSERKFIKEILASNKLFEKASKAGKRVMVAQDTILRLQNKQIEACKGRIFSDNTIYPGDTSLKEILELSYDSPICEICAKGGLFVSYVGRVNEVKLQNIEDDSAHSSCEMKKLKELFTPKQLDLIECAFEGELIIEDNFDIYNSTRDRNLVDKAKSYYSTFFNAKERLIKICENIIDNKGTFKP